MDTNLAQKFQELFRSNESAVTFGSPTDQRKPNGKAIWKYRTERRPVNVDDVRAHLRGERSVVAIPIRQDSACTWGAIDVDDYRGKLNPIFEQSVSWLHPIPGSLTFYCFSSKSGGIHIFVFFQCPQPAHEVRKLLRWLAIRLGYPTVEVFPKQDHLDDAKQCGNGINLPFFGDAAAFAEFKPCTNNDGDVVLASQVAQNELPEESSSSTILNYANDGEPGYWDADALLALLHAFNKRIPGFKFRPCRHGFSVPCPGNLPGGWPDGAKHSTGDPLLSHETLIWLRNGWPVYRCVHAHCDGGAGATKKTWRDFIEYYDPLRLFFDLDEWQDRVLNLAAAECWSGSTTSKANWSRPDSADCSEDHLRGAK